MYSVEMVDMRATVSACGDYENEQPAKYTIVLAYLRRKQGEKWKNGIGPQRLMQSCSMRVDM